MGCGWWMSPPRANAPSTGSGAINCLSAPSCCCCCACCCGWSSEVPPDASATAAVPAVSAEAVTGTDACADAAARSSGFSSTVTGIWSNEEYVISPDPAGGDEEPDSTICCISGKTSNGMVTLPVFSASRGILGSLACDFDFPPCAVPPLPWLVLPTGKQMSLLLSDVPPLASPSAASATRSSAGISS